MKYFKNLRLAFCKNNKNRDWSNVVFKDELSFYLHSAGLNKCVSKGENSIVVKQNTLKSAYMGSILRHGNYQFRIFWRKHIKSE